MPDHGPDIDISAFHADETLERELREALKSEGEIELFKTLQQRLRVRGELADSSSVRHMLGQMWTVVANFFEEITDADTLAKLPHDHPIVVGHQRMQANFTVVAGVNEILKKGLEAETELLAVDQMDHPIEE